MHKEQLQTKHCLTTKAFGAPLPEGIGLINIEPSTLSNLGNISWWVFWDIQI